MLIDQANKARAQRGIPPAHWVYKGYGIFQYDLQDVKSDRAFFEEMKWYQFGECLDRLASELRGKYSKTHDVFLAIQSYTGSGAAAQAYLSNVKQFIDFCREVQ